MVIHCVTQYMRSLTHKLLDTHFFYKVQIKKELSRHWQAVEWQTTKTHKSSQMK